MRQQTGSGTPWEAIAGYSRAVRVGNMIEVAGTTAMDGDQQVGVGDPYRQTQFILHKIEQALVALGGSLQQVVRTRMFVTDISRWEEVARAHGEVFGNIRPAATMVEVQRLISDELLVEIEATAVVED